MADIRNTPMLDDCQRADEDPLSFGGRWRPAEGGPAFWNGDYGGLELDGNTIGRTGVNPSATSVSYWVPGYWSTNLEAWGIVGPGADLSEGLRMFICVTGPESSFSGYQLQMNNAVGDNLWRIQRWDGGASTELDRVPGNAYYPTHDHMVLFRYEDGRISSHYSTDGGANWTEYLVVSDSTYPEGYIGIGVDQDDSNPSWKGFGGGEFNRTQIYRYVSN